MLAHLECNAFLQALALACCHVSVDHSTALPCFCEPISVLAQYHSAMLSDVGHAVLGVMAFCKV